MKNIIILVILSISLPLAGQVPDVIPDDYERKYKRLERRTDRFERRNEPDVILDPIESLPIEPSFYALETGNWGPSFLGINQRADEIRQRAKRGVAVFIFDTGGCYDHPMLKDVTWNELGRSFTGEPCEDGHGHSTHVAGIIAASTDAYPLGIARMLTNIRVIPIKVLSNRGSGSYGNITQGTEYANAEAAKLIDAGWFVVYNYSLGGGSEYAPLETAFKEARELGVLINCAANGNTGSTPIQYPGRSEYTLGIAALQQSGGGVTRASYSSYGPETWAAAPGSSILSTWPGGGTRILSGTSMATPHQAGLFAILAAIYPDANAEDLRAHFIEHASNLGSPGKDDYYGYGVGLANALLDNAPDGGDPPPPPPDDPTCDDGKQNGDETGVDCGGSCPPCEEPEPEKPEYRGRDMVIVMKGPWTIGWWNSDKYRSITGRHPKIYDWDSADVLTLQDGSIMTANGVNLYNLETEDYISPAGMSQIVVHELTYRVDSESTHTWEYGALKSNLDQFFGGNRAIGTPDMDAWDAGRYVPFWPDYGACNEKWGAVFQELTPVGAVLEWKGERIYLEEGDLIDYKCRNKK